GANFPSLEFNDIRADLSVNSTSKFRFVDITSGSPASNVWVHAADPRTIYPSPVEPNGYVTGTPTQLDARIQIVYPHDNQGNLVSVDKATKVNLAVDLFQHGTRLSVPVGSIYAPQLMWTQGNGDIQTGPTASQQTTYSVAGSVYPRWVLNDLPVQGDGQYNFMFQLAPMGSDGFAFSTIWTHGASPLTLLPNPVAPASCIS
ncbi:MAG TPA: hypothetical protein VGK54_05150, partial [Chloroflexota bacterium]